MIAVIVTMRVAHDPKRREVSKLSYHPEMEPWLETLKDMHDELERMDTHDKPTE